MGILQQELIDCILYHVQLSQGVQNLGRQGFDQRIINFYLGLILGLRGSHYLASLGNWVNSENHSLHDARFMPIHVAGSRSSCLSIPSQP